MENDNMPYNELVPHLTAEVIQAVADSDTAKAEKICFTLMCEKRRNELANNKDDLALVTVALANIRLSDTAKEVYKTSEVAFGKHVERLKAA